MNKLCMSKRLKNKKYKVQQHSCCNLCSRTRGFVFLRKFGICRCCLRKLVTNGEIPGFRKVNN